MKRYAMFVLACLMLATSLLSGCRPKEQPLYVMLMWHQHQPYYAPDENGVYTRPWARVHATKDYYDMAAILKDYPNQRLLRHGSYPQGLPQGARYL